MQRAMERVSGMAVAASSTLARASAASMSGNALAQQRREKGHFVTPNKKVGTRFKNMQWVNRGNASDKRVFKALQGHVKSGRALRKHQTEHLAWGPRNFIRFANVRDMRRELEAESPDFASGTPCVLHSNSQDIVGADFDFDAILKERGEYSVPEGHFYDADEYMHAWNKEELERLRGNKWHKKYYNGAFPLHSL
eukprot:Rhum_TRINITY_DN969_c0_g2::Rhum_TRINITY_DN969_c0_g2_i1::g.2875::m.2875